MRRSLGGPGWAAPSNKPVALRKGSPARMSAAGGGNRPLRRGVAMRYRQRKRLDGLGPTEGFVEYIRAKREVRHALVISDPQPVDSVKNMWASAGRPRTSAFSSCCSAAFLYVGRAILLPILAAAVVALTLAPLIKAAKRHRHFALAHGAPHPRASASARSACWRRRWPARSANGSDARPRSAPSIKQKLSVLDQPLAALRELGDSLFGSNGTGLRQSAPPTSCCRSSPFSRLRPASCCCSSSRCCSFSSARSSCAIRPLRCSPTAMPSCGF